MDKKKDTKIIYILTCTVILKFCLFRANSTLASSVDCKRALSNVDTDDL